MPEVLALHPPRPDHLERVTAEMREMGPPVIRVLTWGPVLVALEGSHRLAAADALGLAPRWEILSEDEEIDLTAFDWFLVSPWRESRYPGWIVANQLASSLSAVPYTFPDAPELSP